MRKINYKRQLNQEIRRRKIKNPIIKVYKNSPKLSTYYVAELWDGEKIIGLLIPGASLEEINTYIPENMTFTPTYHMADGLIGFYK